MLLSSKVCKVYHTIKELSNVSANAMQATLDHGVHVLEIICLYTLDILAMMLSCK